MNKLDRAYAMVPDVQCKGLCQECCGPVVASFAEEDRLRDRHGATIDFDKTTLTCTLLVQGRCSVYADRPLLCRVWGSVEKMQCPHGCVPAAGLMKPRDERKVTELVYGKTR